MSMDLFKDNYSCPMFVLWWQFNGVMIFGFLGAFLFCTAGAEVQSSANRGPVLWNGGASTTVHGKDVCVCVCVCVCVSSWQPCT